MFLGNGTVTSSASSSRNNSPRPLTDAKLRVNVTNRNLNNLQQRNSVNYTSSTLQEDLMKLIDPDFMMSSSDDNFHPNGMPHNHRPPQKNIQNSHSLGNISNLTALKPTSIITDDLLLMRKKSRSREAINLGSHGLPISSEIKYKINDDSMSSTSSSNNSKQDSEVIFARPATVIATNQTAIISNGGINSSQQTNEPQIEKSFQNLLYIKEDGGGNCGPKTPRKNSSNISMLQKRKISDSLMQQLLPAAGDSKEVDWTRLVDHAIMQVNEGLKHSASSNSIAESNSHNNFYEELANNDNNGGGEDDHSTSSKIYHQQQQQNESPSSQKQQQQQQISSSTSLPELQNQVTQLEDRISKETRRRKSLEHAVRRLTDENRRLQDESQAAVQQLRRFTEWFFQTIDRQS